MDCAVWERLPDSLLEKIITMVPIQTISSMRSVSKEWSSLILSEGFLNLCSMNANLLYFLFFIGVNSSGSRIASLDPASRTWHTICLDFIQPGREISILASAGGIVCLTAGSKIAVCNPLTGSWKYLPSLPSCSLPMPLLTAMTVDHSTKSYKILVAAPGGSTSDPRTFLYDSCSPTWLPRGDLPETIGFESNPIVIGKTLYVISCLPYRILAFDLGSGEWSKIAIPLPTGSLNPHLVMDSLGSLLLVAAHDHPRPTAVFIWRLNGDSWGVVGQMPEEISKDFLMGGGYDSFKCIGRGNSIHFSSYDAEYVCIVDVATGIWERVPSCSQLAEARCFLEGMFVVEPALYIPV